MAKIPFSKLKIKKVDDSIKTVEFEGQTIEVRQYLPIQEKLALISRVVELAHEQDSNFSNPVKADVYTNLEMFKAYTNISFTEKQLEDPAHLYDILLSSGLLEEVYVAIPSDETSAIVRGVTDSIAAFYKYQNSVLGLLDTITSDYNLSQEEIQKIQSSLTELSDSPNLKGLMRIVNKEA